MLWRDGLGEARQAAARRRLASLGIVQLAFKDGALAVLDHDSHPQIRSWPEVRVIGAVSLQPRQIDGAVPSRTIPSTVRATR